MESGQQNRRSFLGKIATALVVAAGLVSIPSLVRLLIPGKLDSTGLLRIGFPEDYPVNVATFIEEHEVFILRTHEGTRAMSSVCTHLGCIVQASEKGYLCPCHGSWFDSDGHVMRGAASRDLAFYRVGKASDGRLVVDKGHRVSPDESFTG